MIKLRILGAFCVVLGSLGAVLGIGAIYWGLGELVALTCPALAIAFTGLNLVVSPGLPKPEGRFDFTDWFERLPMKTQVRYYVSGGLGFAAGVLVPLYLANWDLWALL